MWRTTCRCANSISRLRRRPIVPRIVLHKRGETFYGEVAVDTNLVVRAGIRQFPYPNLSYGCGMGKCGRCACRVLAGAEHLPAPNWKEAKRLGDRLAQGFRLVCQLWITHDIELHQDDALNAAAPRGNQ